MKGYKKMIKMIGQTHTANIYGVYENDKMIGSIEIKLTGPDAGLHAYTISGRHTKNDIKKIYRQERR